MFIKVHIKFFISGHNSDNRYKKPPASYLNKVQQNAQVHIAELRFTNSYHILRISWAYLRHILGISWACLGHILGISWAYLRQTLENIWAYFDNILGIYWLYHVQILGLYWEYFGQILSISRPYIGHLLDTSWYFQRAQLFAKMTEEETLSSAYDIVSEFGGCMTQADGKYLYRHVLED